ncbi:hypothetical protein HX875_03955 [Pseudomonas yamanorum]|uniref:hypothetical protein n=1 Tax=Pseudomonas yamanorum TaxID=515393 RepID=UPI0015A2010E|nr:hypothetical protein [Pseudomonas yamanorum]NWE38612.1 hypothetical protein [Pseudomonas yamanorum]
MQIRVLSDELEVIWVKTDAGGVTSDFHRRDGTLEKIIDTLQRALNGAYIELQQPVSFADPAVSNSEAMESYFSEREGLV